VTQQRAREDLAGTLDALWSAVGELVLIALEDAPRPSDLAVFDDLVDSVSELQGHVAGCRDLLAADAPTLSAATLADLQHQLAAASHKYWRGIRAYDCVAELRRATRARGSEWTAWFGTVDESAARCEAHLWAAQTACHAAWGELVESRDVGGSAAAQRLRDTRPLTQIASAPAVAEDQQTNQWTQARRTS
jgi:hypothetical protein